MNKLVPMVLFYLEDGEKPRHKVTEKIKNYSKPMREDAIRFLTNGKLIKMIDAAGTGKGRTPVVIMLTEKGIEFTKELSRTPRNNSVWGSV